MVCGCRRNSDAAACELAVSATETIDVDDGKWQRVGMVDRDNRFLHFVRAHDAVRDQLHLFTQQSNTICSHSCITPRPISYFRGISATRECPVVSEALEKRSRLEHTANDV